jgi:hypothetical protein
VLLTKRAATRRQGQRSVGRGTAWDHIGLVPVDGRVALVIGDGIPTRTVLPCLYPGDDAAWMRFRHRRSMVGRSWKQDFGLELGPPLTTTRQCSSAEAAWNELERMLAALASQVQSRRPMTKD